jgi:hypothetical protein
MVIIFMPYKEYNGYKKVNSRDTVQLSLKAHALAASTYNYTLFINGRKADTKKAYGCLVNRQYNRFNKRAA